MAAISYLLALIVPAQCQMLPLKETPFIVVTDSGSEIFRSRWITQICIRNVQAPWHVM
jgi:hypothetical protein